MHFSDSDYMEFHTFYSYNKKYPLQNYHHEHTYTNDNS